MQQMLLDLPRGVELSREAWVSTRGTRAAEEALARGDALVALYGPEGCGKTHLLAMWAQEHADWLVLDDVERLPRAGQELLFHEFNARGGKKIAVASARPVAQLELLPDLKSRLLLGAQVEMGLPEDDELVVMLQRWAEARQLVLPQPVVDYVLVRAARNPKQLLALVVQLDTLSLEEKRAVSVPLARRVLEQGE